MQERNDRLKGNVCPHCGKHVTPYRRFLREAEPSKIFRCGSCNAGLKRSPVVYIHVGVMSLLLALIGAPLSIAMIKALVPQGIMWAALILLLAFWVLLTNYASWRYIGWVIPAEKKENNN